MHHDLSFPADRRFALVITHGAASLEGFLAFTLEVARHPAWASRLSMLVDHRDLDLSTMKKSDVDAYRRFCTKLLSAIPAAGAGAVRAATVVARPLDFGIVRQWEIPLEDELVLVHRAFQSYTDAETWLARAPAEPEASVAPEEPLEP